MFKGLCLRIGKWFLRKSFHKYDLDIKGVYTSADSVDVFGDITPKKFYDMIYDRDEVGLTYFRGWDIGNGYFLIKRESTNIDEKLEQKRKELEKKKKKVDTYIVK